MLHTLSFCAHTLGRDDTTKYSVTEFLFCPDTLKLFSPPVFSIWSKLNGRAPRMYYYWRFAGHWAWLCCHFVAFSWVRALLAFVVQRQTAEERHLSFTAVRQRRKRGTGETDEWCWWSHSRGGEHVPSLVPVCVSIHLFSCEYWICTAWMRTRNSNN